MARPIGVNGIAQPLALPHLLEQPGGDAPAQNGGEQLEGKPLGGVVVQTREGQGQVILFNGLGRDHERRGIHRRHHRLGRPGGQGGKPPAKLVQNFLGKAP